MVCAGLNLTDLLLELGSAIGLAFAVAFVGAGLFWYFADIYQKHREAKKQHDRILERMRSEGEARRGWRKLENARKGKDDPQNRGLLGLGPSAPVRL